MPSANSRYLANTKPGLKFFLDEDNFAQLIRGRYGSKFDRKSRFEIFMEAGREAAAGRPAYTPPAPPPPRPAPEPSPIEDVPRFVVNLCAGAGMTAPAIAVKWRAWVSELEAAGWATGKAQQSVTEACRRARPVPGAVADVDQVILNTAKGVAA